MSQFSTSITEVFRSFWRNRRLIFALISRDVLGRYRGSIIGVAWSFFNPLFMLLIYTFVFSVVFKAKWGEGVNESKSNFAIILFVGLIVHNFFSECVNRSTGLISGNANYVKKVIFPLEILPWVNIGSALFHAGVSLIVLIFANLLINQTLNWTIIFYPLLFIPLIFFSIGLSWFLSSIGVFFKDIGYLANMAVTVLMFATPVFYPVSSLPVKYQSLMNLNPLAYFIEEGRRVLLYGNSLMFGQWLVMLAFGFLVLWLGFFWFQKTRKGFADVL